MTKNLTAEEKIAALQKLSPQRLYTTTGSVIYGLSAAHVDTIIGHRPIPGAESESESNLMVHARRELQILGEDPEVVEGYLKMIQIFADMGHSGGSASVFIPTLAALLRFENLKPLTNDPMEWSEVGEEMWQNVRNGAAFSNDGGETYWLVSDGSVMGRPLAIYTSVDPSVIAAKEDQS